MPGMLPVINRYCVEQAVRTGLGLKARINHWSRFDRKNYFYPDLPQGYQISQFKDPIVGEGSIEVERDDGSTFHVGIERLHLEQDAGKSIHDMDPSWTYVDLNRAGVALMEIVSRPDMRSPEDAAAYVKTLRALVRRLGTCDGDMEKGNLRADVNVSVRRPGDALGTRCEIKNVNSLRFIQQAIAYEAAPPGGDPRGRRRDRPGDPPVRCGARRDPLDALQGGGARLPLLPRSRPPAAGAGPCLGEGDPGQPAGTAGRAALKAAVAVWPVGLRRPRTGGRPSPGRLFRDGGGSLGGAGLRRQAGRQLDLQQSGRPAGRSGQGDRGQPDPAAGPVGAGRPNPGTGPSRPRSRARCSTACGRAKGRRPRS